MVSLGGKQNRRGGGAMTFDDRSVNAEDEGGENTPLIDSLEPAYRRIRTTPYIVIHILLTTVFITFITLLCLKYCQQHKDDHSPLNECENQTGYHIALYIHAASYPISVIFDRIYHHYQDLSRRDGYLEFYRKTRNLRRTPLFIVSTANALLVAFILLMEDYRTDNVLKNFTPEDFLVVLAGVETLIIISTLMWYLIRTIRFNKQRARPDATEDDILSSFISPQIPTNELGYPDETYRENVLEKQADLIRYLHERNEELTRLVLEYKQRSHDFHGIDRRL